MRHRSAVKTGRAAVQAQALHRGSFADYAAMVERLATLTAWILALVLVAATFAASRPQAQERPASADASITQRVERALANDPFLRSMEIYVETQDAVVNLSGFVRSMDDISKAGELARAVSGVSAVRNGLRVANRPSRV